MAIQSDENVTGNINSIKSAYNGVSDINVQKDNISQYRGNDTLSQLIDQCKNSLTQIKQGTDKYQQTIMNAKHAFEKVDKNIGKHFMNSGVK